MSLREAREKAAEIRKVARQGIDPLEAKRNAKPAVVIPTFAEACRTVRAEQKKGWKNRKHGDQWLTTLENHAWPMLGGLQMDRTRGR